MKKMIQYMYLVFGFMLIMGTTLGQEQIKPFYTDSEFWQHWGDGQAEMASYDLTFPRYGELREGTAVTIFVTETFSNIKRVKSDSGVNPKLDEFPVLKLNLMQDFPTGVYDYNMMLSTFVALNGTNGLPGGTPTKVAFNSQEWCGHVYHHLLFDEKKIRSDSHSYFDGEADQRIEIDFPENGVSEDVLFHWARGLAAPVLKPGEKLNVKILNSLEYTRLRHKPLKWFDGEMSISAETSQFKVPAGDFEVYQANAELKGLRNWTFYVEVSAPHRIIKWEASDGRKAELIAEKRMPYWRMNRNADLKSLSDIGLKPREDKTM